MNRPANLGDKLYFTEQELQQSEARLARQAETDKQEFVADNARAGTGPPGHWGERARRPCKQTSLVIDPPNGRTPDLLPEARNRPIPDGAGNTAPKAESWEDFSWYIRCYPTPEDYPDFMGFARFIGRQAARDFPRADRVRVRLMKQRTPSPEEVRAGIEPETEATGVEMSLEEWR